MLLKASLIEKFINIMGLDYEIIITNAYRGTWGRKNVCIKVRVFSKPPEFKMEYIQNHCYHLRNGKIIYDQGNTVQGVGQGVLAYIGDNEAVDNYFDALARDKAKEFFDENFD